MKSWYDRLKSYPVSAAARSLNLKVEKSRATPCPACRAERIKDGAAKGSSRAEDKRWPVKILASDSYWICNACQFEGNIFDMVSWKVHGCAAKELTDFSILREWQGAPKGAYHEEIRYKPEPEPEYPPIDEIRDFTTKAAVASQSANHKLNRWLEKRGLDKNKIPAWVADPDFDCEALTEVTSSKGNQTPWWPRQWLSTYPLIIPLVDYRGNLVSFVGRTTGTNRRKTTVPIGYSTKNLVNASRKALEFMRKDDIPEKIWITEGEMDYLSIAQHGPATIGIRSGSITNLALLPWREQQTVFIATDNDRQGKLYAERVAENIFPAMAARINLDQIGKK